MKEDKKNIEMIINSSDDLFAACTSFTEFLSTKKDAEEKKELFKEFLCDEHLKERKNTEEFTRNVESEEDIQKAKGFVSLVVDNLTGENVSESDFYERLLRQFDTLDDRTKIFFLINLCMEKRIPYCQLEDVGIVMSDEAFSKYCEEIKTAAEKAEKIIFDSKLQQKTQVASLLMKVVDQIKDKKKKAVFWALVFNLIATKYSLKEEQIEKIIETYLKKKETT